MSTVLFAYIDWPLLGETELSSLVWLSIVLLLPSIAFYQWSSREQANLGGCLLACSKLVVPIVQLRSSLREEDTLQAACSTSLLFFSLNDVFSIHHFER